MSRALPTLVERGVRADLEARRRLEAAYRGFTLEPDSEVKTEAGNELIRAIFGDEAIATDPVL